MKLEKPYGIILLVLIALIILAILFPPFAYKENGDYLGHYYLFTQQLYGSYGPSWDWVLAEVFVLVLLAAGAAVAVKTFEKKPKKGNNHEH